MARVMGFARGRNGGLGFGSACLLAARHQHAMRRTMTLQHAAIGAFYMLAINKQVIITPCGLQGDLKTSGIKANRSVHNCLRSWKIGTGVWL